MSEQERLVIDSREGKQPFDYAVGMHGSKFFKAIAEERKILGIKCPECGKVYVPPRRVCGPCYKEMTEFVEVGPKGTVTINDIVYYSSPDPLTGEARETPYGSINVLLDGCKGNETFWHFIRPDQTFKIKERWNEDLGTRVRPVWADDRKGEVSDILYFEIDE